MSLTAMLHVEAYFLGVWWSDRYPCETGYHLRSLGAVAIHGALAWIFVRGLVLALR